MVSQMRKPEDGMVQDSPSVTTISDGEAQQQRQGERQDEWLDEQQVNSISHGGM
jgi:hypothetical protein